MRIKLIEDMPLFYKEVITWYNAGEMFEVVETKLFPLIKQPFYKIKSVRFNIELDGWCNSDSFVVVEN